MPKFKCLTVMCFGWIISIFQFTSSLRRITDGQEIKAAKPYMVYMVKAKSAKVQYDAWICGGVIVSPKMIITAAACVEDVQYMYAIAGTKKYLQYEATETDECAKVSRKKVVQFCVPKVYEFSYHEIEKWSNIDIAVAQVESPYKFGESFGDKCDYAPQKLLINLHTRYQAPGTDAMVLGWGHLTKWRKPEDSTDYNQPSLRSASIALIDKQVCKNIYQNISSLLPTIIDKYMICADGKGVIDDDGTLIDTEITKRDGCNSTDQLRSEMCEKELILKQNMDMTRRNGICQNDHGGPIITWIGGKEMLIGVASVFRIDAKSECTGPYLFTSTACNSAFIQCLLNTDDHLKPNKHEDKNKTRLYSGGYLRTDFNMAICTQPAALRGFDMVNTRISWVNHPDGPAKNEMEGQQNNQEQHPKENKRESQHQARQGQWMLQPSKLKTRAQIPLHKLT